MDATFVLKISKLYVELHARDFEKTESFWLDRFILLLIHVLSPYFQPVGTVLQKHHVTLPMPPENDYKRLAAGTHFR